MSNSPSGERLMESQRAVPRTSPTNFTVDDARAFIAAVPWRQVQDRPAEGTEVAAHPDPHQYVILGWTEVPDHGFRHFAKLIKDTGYKGRYTPPYNPSKTYTNRYLEVDGWIYWWVYPKMMNRQRADLPLQHERIPEQTSLLGS